MRNELWFNPVERQIVLFLLRNLDKSRIGLASQQMYKLCQGQQFDVDWQLLDSLLWRMEKLRYVWCVIQLREAAAYYLATNGWLVLTREEQVASAEG
jgi:hypothetical protein